jgi:branched-subunit amino acid transport protein
VSASPPGCTASRSARSRSPPADLIPVALLSALVAVQVFSSGHQLVIDERAAGLAAAVVLLLLRAPFLVVVFGAALTAALLRLAG